MTVSRTAKRLLGLALVGTCFVVYIVLVLACGLGDPWKFLGATQLRAFVPAVALLLMGRDLMRFVRVKHEKGGEKGKPKVEVEERNPQPQTSLRPPSSPQASPPPQPPSSRQPQPPTFDTASGDGEALFIQAREMPHQEIPDFEFDGEYLDLLGKSAATGYAPALAKLGEYAMRRSAWVEAYYWMSMAKRQGMQGLANVLREIRENWSLDGYPDEADNVYRYFTVEAGSLGRALLHVDSGHDAAGAREFLEANYPEWLKGSVRP